LYQDTGLIQVAGKNIFFSSAGQIEDSRLKEITRDNVAKLFEKKEFFKA